MTSNGADGGGDECTRQEDESVVFEAVEATMKVRGGFTNVIGAFDAVVSG